jgi:hypothetical protein
VINVSKKEISSNTAVITLSTTATGYTGFKADYSLQTTSGTSSRTGLLLGAWNNTSVTQINDKHTLSFSSVNNAIFTLTKSSTVATLTLNLSGGIDHDLNILITAFKKQV